MNKSLLFAYVIFCVTARAQTSVYHPFPDSNAVWIVSGGCCNQAIGCGVVCCDFMSRYEMAGDTIINGRSYHKINTAGTWSCNPPCAGPCMFMPPGGYIREDTTKKIWWLYPFIMTDTLLYDFNLNIGDTIRTALTSFPDTNIVQSIDSILIGSDYRKVFYYSSSNYMPDTCTHFLIEGIGSGAGLFSELCGSCFEHGYALQCFKQNNIVTYYQNNPGCNWIDTGLVCNFTVPVTEINSENYFSLSPNPASNEIRIERSDLKIDLVKIFDVLGQLQTSYSQLPNCSINISSLLPGMYFIQLKTENGMKTVKFIKQ